MTVIGIWDNPLGEMKKLLEERDGEISALKAELEDQRAANLKLKATADLLLILFNDLSSTLTDHQRDIGTALATVNTIKSKLPVI